MNDEKDKKRIIFCDLDKTLARMDEYKGDDIIGDPIPAMVDKIKQEIKQGSTVVIFSARASNTRNVNAIKDWLYNHKLPAMRVTNVKEPEASVFWDDRAQEVIPNTGKFKVPEEEAEYSRDSKPTIETPKETISKGH